MTLGYDSLLQLRLLDRLRADYPPLRDITVAEVLPKIHSVGDSSTSWWSGSAGGGSAR